MSLPPNPLDQPNLSASSDPKFSASSAARPRQSAWGVPSSTSSSQQGSRRGLTSLNTSLNSASSSSDSRRSILTSPPVGTAPAFAWGTTSTSSAATGLNSSIIGGTNRAGTNSNNSASNSSSNNNGVGGGGGNIIGSARHTPSVSTSTTSPFAPLSGGQQQLGGPSSQLLSPRSRANTPFSSQTPASSAAAGPATTSSSGGGGNSGNGSGGGLQEAQKSSGPRSGTFSPTGSSTHGLSSPTNSGFDRGGFGGSTPSGSGGSSLAKITVTQVFLLLSSITDKEGKGKWETQAESIRKLVAEHGMEVFTKYFRRLVTGNAAQIFPGHNGRVENAANYPLLVEEVEKVSKDPEQARRIADTIDASDGDLFRDFDLATFVNHFELGLISSTLLVAAFSHSQKADLRKKASTILSATFTSFIARLGDIKSPEKDLPDLVIASAAFEVLRSGIAQRDGSDKREVYFALDKRYNAQDKNVPDIVSSAMALIEILDSPGLDLSTYIVDRGWTATDTVAAAEETLRSYRQSEIDEKQLSLALICIVLSPNSPRLWKPQNFVTAAENLYGNKISWPKVVQSFDRESIWITAEQFLRLYNALLPMVRKKPDLDIQSMWGGEWNNPGTQLAFAIAFAALGSDQLDAQTIPNLRQCYDVDECFEGLDGFDEKIKEAKHDPMISLDAATAIMRVVWTAQTDIQAHSIHSARAVIQEKITLFLCSCGSLPQPWSPQHATFMEKFITNCLMRNQPDYQFILHCIWKQNKTWMAQKLHDWHATDPMKLPYILEHAQEHKWLDELCTTFSGFGIDFAAYAHRKGLMDLQEWIEDKTARGIQDLGNSLAKFLEIKAQDEMRTLNHEQPSSRTVILSMKTVHQMLLMLEEEPFKIPPPTLRVLQRTCVRAYPRLINYGGEWDELIEANGANSNQLMPGADAAMQEYYKRMYNQELAVRDIIQILSSSKESTDPQQQDLFACMIHGLFDEFVCFHEYPLAPLATTAVLFGGIISYRLISGIALKIALGMVLEAVRDYEPDSSMFKFGLQAILHFLNRLPEWPEFCQELVQISGLQGTEAYARAQDALREGRSESGEANGTGEHEAGLVNGDSHDEPDSLVQHFRSISSDVMALDSEHYSSPDDDVQGKVLFVLNNVTDENLTVKMSDLLDVLERKYYHWFAEYLVDQRAKFQANYQPLYLKILDIINARGLWAEVLHETYVSVQKVMNAEATMQNAADRTHLKNLATWLGSLTLARDKPIKHKNIAFKELLIEGFETQRLILVIPFTCEVLSQGARSKVFKPPNPWVNEIISILMEIYDMEQTKIQQKFAIELLLSNLGLPRTGEGIERASEIKKRQLERELELKHVLPDSLHQDFQDLGEKQLQRFSPPMPLIDLTTTLVYPQLSTSNPAQQERVRSVVQHAIQTAIQDIAQLVVERSVTVAEIATKELVQKDFALDGDEEKLRNAFLNMVRPLASSLANVTCKEPLKQSISNYMRQAATEMPDDLPEGTILVTINDNIDIACEHVRSTAEEKAIAEIDAILEEEVVKRREHKRNYPNEPYRDPQASQWSGYLPEPFKMGPGGLNNQQLDIYRNFGPQTRGIVNHAQQASTDSGRQVPDVLQDSAFPNMPNLSTPAEQPAMPHQPSVTQSRGTPAVSDVHVPSQINGYLDYATVMSHIQSAFAEITEATKVSPGKRWRDLAEDDPIMEACERIVSLMRSSQNPDTIAREIAPVLCQQIYEENLTRFDLEVKTKLAYLICQLSNELMLSVQGKFHRVIEQMAMDAGKVVLMSCLLESGFIDYSMVDNVMAAQIVPQAGGEVATEAMNFLEELLQLQLFASLPVALRSDFNKSLGVIGRLAAEDHPQAKHLVEQLRLPNAHVAAAASLLSGSSRGALASEQQGQIRYVLDEWINLVNSPNATEASYVAFVDLMRHDSVFDDANSLVELMRYGFDMAIECSMHTAFSIADALAKLVVILSRTQGTDAAGTESLSPRPHYMKQLLTFVVLILNHQQNTLNENFNQRIFCRFFSTIIYDWQAIMFSFSNDENKQMLFAFADIFMLLNPSHFPGFVHSWISLVSHRVFMPMLLKLPNNEGGEIFTDIIVALFKFVCPMLQPKKLTATVRELYRGVLKLMLILHHDFAEFLVENHIRLCNVIPAEDNQLRNLVLSAQPSSYADIPDPLTVGLRADRITENRRVPPLAGDNMTQNDREMAKELVEAILKDTGSTKARIEELKRKIESFEPDRSAEAAEACLSYLHFVVLYLAQSSLKASKPTSGSTLEEGSIQARCFAELSQKLRPDCRYYFLSAIFNQLRYPNSHTHYFNYVLFHVWFEEQKQQANETEEQDDSSDSTDGDSSTSSSGSNVAEASASAAARGTVREQISRIVLERMMVHKPHPWGLLLMTMELLKNSKYKFWEVPFIKTAPEAKQMFMVLYQNFEGGQRMLG